MNLRLPGREILVFTHPHRTYDYAQYRQHHEEMMSWSEKYGCEGMLCSTSSYDYFDPWLWAQFLCSKTENLKPFIAINPIYMHPFSAARMVASLTHLYGRKIWVNFITGSAKADLEQLNDSLAKPERYARLGEYFGVMMQLLSSKQPIYFAGKHYTLNGATLMTHLEPELIPGITWSGESEVSIKMAAELNLLNLQMLPSGEVNDSNCKNKSLAFGIVARETPEDAWEAANKIYPPDRFGQKLLKVSMERNETDWKARIGREMEAGSWERGDGSGASATPGVRLNPLYWLEPFKNKYADCPYLVGSYAELAEFVATLAKHEAHSFVLTIKTEEEFGHIDKVFRMVEINSP